MEIRQIVSYLEDNYDIDVLYVNEVGSRAFNLHSSESDHDIYIVFRQPLKEYAKIDTYKENITEDNIIDNWEVQGWNIKRFAELMYKSNPTTMEFSVSPLKHYVKNDEFKTIFDEFCSYAVANVNPIGLYYHYQSLADKNYTKYIKETWEINREEIAKSSMGDYLGTMEHDPKIRENNDQVELSFGRAGNYTIEKAYDMNFVKKTTTKQTVKRNLFVLRGICYAKWVKNYKTMPPLDFEQFIEKEDFLDENILTTLNELIAKKRNNNNENVGNVLSEFVESELNTRISDNEYNKGKLDKNKVNKFIEDNLTINI